MASVISKTLEASLKNGGTASAVVVMARETQEVLSKIETQQFANRDARADAVTSGLQELAKDSQKHLKEFLDSQTPPVQYQSMWISNTLIIKNATLDLLQKLEKLGGIKEIREEHTAHLLEN